MSDQDQEVMTQDDLNENISDDFLDSGITYEGLKMQYFHRTTMKVVELSGTVQTLIWFTFTFYFGVFSIGYFRKLVKILSPLFLRAESPKTLKYYRSIALLTS